MARMLEIRDVEPLDGRTVRLTLSDGEVVVRDLSDLLRGPMFDRLATDDQAFRCVSVDYGTLVWPGDVDIAPETPIWDGPAPPDETIRRPEPFLRPQPPRARASGDHRVSRAGPGMTARRRRPLRPRAPNVRPAIASDGRRCDRR
jgi:hypothetical protein